MTVRMAQKFLGLLKLARLRLNEAKKPAKSKKELPANIPEKAGKKWKKRWRDEDGNLHYVYEEKIGKMPKKWREEHTEEVTKKNKEGKMETKLKRERPAQFESPEDQIESFAKAARQVGLRFPEHVGKLFAVDSNNIIIMSRDSGLIGGKWIPNTKFIPFGKEGYGAPKTMAVGVVVVESREQPIRITEMLSLEQIMQREDLRFKDMHKALRYVETWRNAIIKDPNRNKLENAVAILSFMLNKLGARSGSQGGGESVSEDDKADIRAEVKEFIKDEDPDFDGALSEHPLYKKRMEEALQPTFGLGNILKGEHVKVEKGVIKLQFKGKDAIDTNIEIDTAKVSPAEKVFYDEYIKLYNAAETGKPLFPTPETYNACCKIYEKYSKGMGAAKLTPHNERHGYAQETFVSEVLPEFDAEVKKGTYKTYEECEEAFKKLVFRRISKHLRHKARKQKDGTEKEVPDTALMNYMGKRLAGAFKHRLKWLREYYMGASGGKKKASGGKVPYAIEKYKAVIEEKGAEKMHIFEGIDENGIMIGGVVHVKSGKTKEGKDRYVPVKVLSYNTKKKTYTGMQIYIDAFGKEYRKKKIADEAKDEEREEGEEDKQNKLIRDMKVSQFKIGYGILSPHDIKRQREEADSENVRIERLTKEGRAARTKKIKKTVEKVIPVTKEEIRKLQRERIEKIKVENPVDYTPGEDKDLDKIAGSILRVTTNVNKPSGFEESDRGEPKRLSKRQYDLSFNNFLVFLRQLEAFLDGDVDAFSFSDISYVAS